MKFYEHMLISIKIILQKTSVIEIVYIIFIHIASVHEYTRLREIRYQFRSCLVVVNTVHVISAMSFYHYAREGFKKTYHI